MPDEPEAQPPESPPPYGPGRRVGTGLAGETTRGEGSTILPGADQRPLEIIGDFEVIGKLGQGGMGAVYRARQISLDRQVALKILPPNFEADADYVSRFQREARIAASLSHPNLVRVYSSGVANGTHFIAMELIEGETLSQWLKHGAMPPLEALRITLDVAHALECGWRTAQLIHRDIKPGNIFLSEEGDVKLGDLGLAKIVGSDSTGLTHTGAAMGTPHYISPEQARGDANLDFRADIYSLGCTLYHMLTKVTPYSGTNAMAVMSMHRDAPPPAILKIMPECPLPLARLVSKMLKKSRRERQASYEELIAQIESVRAQLDPSLATLTMPPAPQTLAPAPRSSGTPAPATIKTRKKPPLALYGGIAAVAVALGVAWLVWPQEEKLTGAQRWARDHTGENKSAADSGAATSDEARPIKPNQTETTVSALAASTGESWQPLLTDEEWKATTRDHELQDGFLYAHGAVRKPQPNADGAVRARLRIALEDPYPHLFMRSLGEDGNYQLVMGRDNASVVLNFFHPATNETFELGHYDLPRPFAVGESVLLELRVEGTHLSVKVNGVPAISAEDNRLTAPGTWGVDGKNVSYESVEVQPLPATASSTPATEQWHDVLHDPAKLGLSGALERTPEGLRFTGKAAAMLTPSQAPRHDGAIRMQATFGFPIQLRVRAQAAAGQYQLYAKNAETIRLESWDNAKVQIAVLRDFPLRNTLQVGQDYILELRVVGDSITAKLNGEILGTVTDTTFVEGVFGVGVGTEDRIPGALVKSLEVLDLDAPANATPANAAVPSSRLSPSTEPWVNALHDSRLIVRGAELTAQGLYWSGKGTAGYNSLGRDCAARVLVPYDPATKELVLRLRGSAKGNYQIHVASTGNFLRLARPEFGQKGEAVLRDLPLPSPLQPGQDYELELRAVGSKLTVKFDGKILGEVIDSTFPRGSCGVDHTSDSPALVKAFEYLDLEAPGVSTPAPAVTSTSRSYPQPSKWVDVTADVRKRGLGSSLEADGEWLSASVPAHLYNVAVDQAFRNCVLRVVFSDNAELVLRRNVKRGDVRYAGRIGQTEALIGENSPIFQDLTPPAKLPVPLGKGVEHEAVFVAQGDELSLWLDGKQVASAHDTSFDSGTLAIGLTKGNRYGDGRVKKIEYGELPDVPPPVTSSAATPAAATKEAPFVNTLGMKFVPVPMVSGPSAGQRVLFSVWDTRVLDYGAYAAANPKVDGSWKTQNKDGVPCGRELDHPVVGVSWEDAQAFCQWLTAKEQAEGKLPKGMKYRLPTDEEWSWAVGLPPELGTTPAEKIWKNSVDFPWGKDYPPTKKVGNYADEAFHAKFPLKKNEKENRMDNQWIEGYNDGYATTSPVGSFSANAYGLYDMGGNVWQWCEDWFDAAHKDRVLRGASWAYDDRGYLLSSTRGHYVPTLRDGTHGFRCVLGVTAR